MVVVVVVVKMQRKRKGDGALLETPAAVFGSR